MIPTKTVEYDCRGKTVCALVWSTRVLWYWVDKKRLVTLVIVRDPDGLSHDFFVTDDDEAADAEVVARYSGRWSIEVTFREVKQCLGGEDPQSWKHQGPERAANLSLWLYSAIWTWHITTFGTQRTWTAWPGIRRSRPRRSSMHSPPFGARCGPIELLHCHSAGGTTRKSSTACSTSWPMPHRCWEFTPPSGCR